MKNDFPCFISMSECNRSSHKIQPSCNVAPSWRGVVFLLKSTSMIVDSHVRHFLSVVVILWAACGSNTMQLHMAIRLTSGVYAKSLPIQRSSGLHDSGVRWDDTPTRPLVVTRWISPFLALSHRHEHTNRQITQKWHPSRLNSSFEIPHFSLPTHSHIFFINRVVL